MSEGNDYWPAKVETMRKIEAELRTEIDRLDTLYHETALSLDTMTAERDRLMAVDRMSNDAYREALVLTRNTLSNLLATMLDPTIGGEHTRNRNAAIAEARTLLGHPFFVPPVETPVTPPGVMDVLKLQAQTDAAVAGLNPLVKCPTCGMGYFKHPMQD